MDTNPFMARSALTVEGVLTLQVHVRPMKSAEEERAPRSVFALSWSGKRR